MLLPRVENGFGGERIGQLSETDMIALSRGLVVFLGIT
jgi:hypothetical protein